MLAFPVRSEFAKATNGGINFGELKNHRHETLPRFLSAQANSFICNKP
jgi:hypothetical protein